MRGDPTVFEERNPALIVVLSMLTCGIYLFVWYYQTTDELRRATGDESIKPGLDILLTFVTCGIWWVYTDYRNAKKAYELATQMGLGRSDQSTMALILDLFAAVVTPLILQTEYNAIGKAARGER